MREVGREGGLYRRKLELLSDLIKLIVYSK